MENFEARCSTLCWATTRFSSTVIFGNRRMFWKVRTTWASRATRWLGSASRRISPRVGWARRRVPVVGL